MRPLTVILAVLTGIAGWFYLFYSKAAHRLGAVEQQAANRWRVGLRRVNGFIMLLLAGLLYAGSYGVDERSRPALFLGIWMGIIISLAAILLLVLWDVRLTVRLRENLKQRRIAGERGGGEAMESSSPPRTPER